MRSVVVGNLQPEMPTTDVLAGSPAEKVTPEVVEPEKPKRKGRGKAKTEPTEAKPDGGPMAAPMGEDG